jgi:Effector-associated domain 11
MGRADFVGKNFQMIFQSHSGSGDNIAGNKTQNMTPQQKIQTAIAKGDIDGALGILDTFSDDATLLMSRWSSLKREKMLGIIDFSNEQIQRNRIVSAILSYAGCDDSVMIQQKPQAAISHSANWESALLQIIKDNERKNQDAAKKALTLLESFRSYYDLKRTRSFFDRSGEKLQEIEASFEEFKKSLSKSSNESVEKFIDRVASLIDSPVPGWPSISDAYNLCVGRGFVDSYIERNLNSTPNDDDAKLSAIQRIETFLGQL